MVGGNVFKNRVHMKGLRKKLGLSFLKGEFMAICAHGEVCRAWMRSLKLNSPLVATCPNSCRYFEPKRDPSIDVMDDVFFKLCNDYCLAREKHNA